MKIQCLVGPTQQTILGTGYTFARDNDGRYVAEVFEPKHIDCFLARSDIYLAIEGDTSIPLSALQPVPLPGPADAGGPAEETGGERDPVIVLGWPGMPEAFDIEGQSYPADVVLQHVATESGLSIDAWNHMAEGARRALVMGALTPAASQNAAPSLPEPPAPVAPPAPDTGAGATTTGAPPVAVDPDRLNRPDLIALALAEGVDLAEDDTKKVIAAKINAKRGVVAAA